MIDFLRAHLEARRHQVRALDLRERVQHQIWLAIEDLVTERGLPERSANAVRDAFFGREVTNRYYREIADVGDITASTDLKGATAAGLLRALGAGRSRRSSPATGFPPISLTSSTSTSTSANLSTLVQTRSSAS